MCLKDVADNPLEEEGADGTEGGGIKEGTATTPAPAGHATRPHQE
jgi:hypothetical protein